MNENRRMRRAENPSAESRGVAQLEACAVSGNAEGDYVTMSYGGGRIEGVDPSLVKKLG